MPPNCKNIYITNEQHTMNKSTKTHKARNIPDLSGSIWFGTNNQNWGSQRRMALLKAIDEEGSISAGAKKIGLSYKGAWDAVDLMNSLADEPLVIRTTGGVKGGGAQLTEKAKHMVKMYQKLEQAHSEFMGHLSDVASTAGPDLETIKQLVIQTSVRNRLEGTVQNVIEGKNYIETSIDIGNDVIIVANTHITEWSRLGLKIGNPVITLIDADAILITLSDIVEQISARNSLDGHIKQVISGSAGSEVIVTLANRNNVACQITTNSLNRLNLAEGCPIKIVFKASAVILAKPD